jgi:formylglycine-generating enzyme required for sulfatase activity
MHGTVWQWVLDCLHDNYQGAPRDGSAWVTACTDERQRIVRGGSWFGDAQALRAANRGGAFTSNRYDDFGFRLARAL